MQDEFFKEDVKRNGLISQLLGKILDIEKFIRQHNSLNHSQLIPGTLSAGFTYVVDGVNFAKTQAGIQAAIDSATDNYSVYVTSGNYSITSSLSVSGKTNFHLIFDKGAVLTATAGVTFTMLGITSSSDVVVTGGIFDCNGVGARCITVYNSGAVLVSRIKIEDTECLGATSDCVSVTHNGSSFWYVEDVVIQNNYVHDGSSAAIAIRAATGTRIVGNRIANIASTENGIFITAINTLIDSNSLSGYSGTTGTGIAGYMAVNTICSNNILDGGAQDTGGLGGFGIYFDAPTNMVIANNTIKGGGTGIRVEVGTDVTINGNTLNGNGYHGINVNGRSDTTQVNALDSAAGITASASITLSIDGADFQEGTGSLQCVVAGAFTTGTMFYQDLASLEDWATRPYLYLWIKSNTIINAGVLQIVLSASTGLASPHTTIDLPYIAASQWIPLRLFSERGFVAPTYSVRSWGIVAASDPGAITLHFDDFRSGTKSSNHIVSDNIITQPFVSGITFDTNGASTNVGIATETVLISNNSIYSAGFGSNYTSGGTYGIFVNSTHTDAVIKYITISGNNVSFMLNGTTSTDRGIGIRAVGGTVDELRILNNNLAKTKTPTLISGTTPSNYTDAGNLRYEGGGGLYSGVSHTIVSRYANAGNVGVGADDLYSDTLAASTFYTNGQSIRIVYTGYFIGHATATRQIIASFGGTTIFDSTALAITATTQWYLDITIVASSISGGTARAIATFRYSSISRTPTETNIVGLTFTNTQILKITGESAGVGGGTNDDVVAQLAQGVWYP